MQQEDLMRHINQIFLKKLWVKVIVKIGEKTSQKLMKIAYADDERISFLFIKEQESNAVFGDNLYRTFLISSITLYENNIVPVFHIQSGILPVISKLPII